jgi:hypothetical protein
MNGKASMDPAEGCGTEFNHLGAGRRKFTIISKALMSLRFR